MFEVIDTSLINYHIQTQDFNNQEVVNQVFILPSLDYTSTFKDLLKIYIKYIPPNYYYYY